MLTTTYTPAPHAKLFHASWEAYQGIVTTDAQGGLLFKTPGTAFTPLIDTAHLVIQGEVAAHMVPVILNDPLAHLADLAAAWQTRRVDA